MVSKLLAEALTTLKAISVELNTPLEKLTAEQLAQHEKDCFTNERLQHRKASENI